MNIGQGLQRLQKSLQKSKFFRFFSLVIASLLVLQFLILPAFTQQPVEIQVFIQALEAAQWQPFADEFNEQNPDINLQIIEGPNNTNLVEDLYTSAFLLGDSPYDLVYMDIVWVPKFAAAGWLMPLDEFVTEDELSEFLEGDVNGGTYNGQLYRMPFRSDAGMLYYRTDWLEQEGYEPPETFTELVNISQQLQEDGITEWGYVWQGKQYEGLSAMFVEVLEGYDAFWVNPDTLEVGLDAPDAVDAVEFLRSTIEKGISPPGVTTYAEEETRRLFQNGKVAFLRNWPYVYSLAQESEIAGKFAIKPMVHTPDANSGACLGGWGLGISKSTNHPDEAWRVVEFFSSRETQKAYSLANGYAPSREDLFTDPEVVEKYSYFPELLEVIQQSVLRPPVAQYAQASDILQRYLSSALTDSMSPKEAMEAAATETRQLFGRR
jgi:multiple sugar transport system substrate-binding protein